MSGLLYAAVADDDTGASDLAGMFADQGVRVVLILDVPEASELAAWTDGADGVIFATATRALPRQDAYRKTAEAAKLALSVSPRTLQIKYCSTFDSTEEGNIGPSIDAAMEATGAKFTIAMPALPVNGRTTYFGYHFVKGQLLSDSPMRHHPLTPMTNANLVDHLSRQTGRCVGLTPCPVVDEGPAAIARFWRELQDKGVQISIVDCLNDRHAANVSEAAATLPLITGGSAFGSWLPEVWRREGWLRGTPEVSIDASDDGCGSLVVAGSCSVATASQNSWLAGHGGIVIEADLMRLIGGETKTIVDEAVRLLRGDATVLLKLSSNRAWSVKQGLDPAAAGLKLANALASVTRTIVDAQQPRVLICAGGETASAICRALGLRALTVGKNIQPGVPLCFPVEGRKMPVVLKSGNFGSEDFYAAARRAAGAMSC